MKWIIAGSRNVHVGLNGLDHALKLLRIDINPDYDTVIAGGCPTGPDAAAKMYSAKYMIDYREYPADWDNEGKAAGPLRNAKMAKDGDALILIWDGESRGSTSMKMEMLRRGKPVYELIIRQHNT